MDEILVERFWERVNTLGPLRPQMTTACWVWTGWTISGYGAIKRKGVVHKAHRLSWAIHNGPIPPGAGYHGTCVLHRCDNRACVRPGHLFLGSNADNVEDKISKGRSRHARGEAQHLAKLTADDVREIRRMRTGGAALQEIADRFGITRSNASQIARRKTWKHVD